MIAIDLLALLSRASQNLTLHRDPTPNLQVGLALVVEGDVALGIMGCPNWKNNPSEESEEDGLKPSGRGMIMIAHVGCGTWSREFLASSGVIAGVHGGWKKCSVDPCSLINQASFCIPESQTWRSLPLSASYGLSDDSGGAGSDHEVVLLKVCCGRYCSISSCLFIPNKLFLSRYIVI